ncbi:hypothetical protein STCU_03451 [Strigomonas culicis]|uniref:Uncharacterized protein n=1 Tax=Strigomonas culicis TaxID=28005 RepID=S9UKS5_9TRYP|nr:hypothetical protein STCU_03451 [Strigomonas culicis]|eukprot:EPY31447.1 hypothetical protein STCU_03451 [Strigomonas culicis]
MNSKNMLGTNKEVRDYWKESRKAAAKPMLCPVCRKRGHFVSGVYEIARRIPMVMASGVCLCVKCKKDVAFQYDGFHKIWMCDFCETVICSQCQT